jgi:hypothetical protein
MITLTLYRRELVKAGACAEGLALFDFLRDAQGRRHSVKVVDWTLLHTVWLATGSPSFGAWLRDRGLVPSANLSGASLSGADLYGANYPTGNLPSGWSRDADGYLVRT